MLPVKTISWRSAKRVLRTDVVRDVGHRQLWCWVTDGPAEPLYQNSAKQGHPGFGGPELKKLLFHRTGKKLPGQPSVSDLLWALMDDAYPDWSDTQQARGGNTGAVVVN